MDLLLAIAVLGLPRAYAQNTTGNSTTPDHLGWVPSSSGRSTMEIVWSCLSVLLVCSYKCIHVNIPSFEEKHAGWHRLCGIPLWPEYPLIRKAFRKVYLMALILIAPEIGVGLAVDQYLAAKEALETARKAVPEMELTLTHGFYSIMGGFGCITVEGGRVEFSQPSQPEDEAALLNPRRSVNFQTTRLGQMSSNEEGITQDDRRSSRRLKAATFDSSTIRRISLTTYAKICMTLPPDSDLIVSEDNLLDRSKSDFVTKFFAIFQSTWLVVQSINRVSHGLPITELELATMAYILCAIVMYGFWWFKPFDAEHIIVMPMPAKLEVTDNMPRWKRVNDINTNLLDEIMSTWDDPGYRQILFYLTAVAFSAIHLAAWNWDFPSPVTKTLWRVFSTVATAAVVELVFQGIMIAQIESIGETTDRMLIVLFFFVILAFVVCRIGIIVLIVYCFRSMPAAVYQTVDLWPSYLPHFS